MQKITDSEFKREVEALKAHRRTSVNRPLLDPDLPEIAAVHGGGREILGSSPEVSQSQSNPAPTSRRGVLLSDEGPLPRTSGTSRSTEGARAPFTARRRGAGDLNFQRQLSSSGRSRDESASSSGSSNAETPTTSKLDPSHLFWVPASMHPEISPSDFRKFLQDHTSRAVREQQEEEAMGSAGTGIGSSNSSSSSSSSSTYSRSATESSIMTPPLSPSQGPSSPPSPVSPMDKLKNRSTSIARRGSTLRRQYRPENDTEDEGPFDGIKGRRPSSSFAASDRHYAAAPTLSIDDLQKLERLAEEASKSSDPSELRSVLRRTMSLNVAPSALDQVDAVPIESEQDAPLIVPRPGQILRRAARTKIRKASFSNEGTARPGGTRRRGGATSPTQFGSIDESHNLDSEIRGVANVSTGLVQKRQSDNSETTSEEDTNRHSDSQSESIVDAHSRESYLFDDDMASKTSSTSLADSIASVGEVESPPQTPTQQSVSSMVRDSSRDNYFDPTKVIPRREAPTLPTRTHRSAASVPSESALETKDISSREVPATRPVSAQGNLAVTSSEKIRPAPVPLANANQEPIHSPAQSAPAPPLQPILPGHGLVKADTMPILPSNQSVSQPMISRPSKEKKSSFGLSWFGIGKEEEETGKESKKEKRERKEREREKERESEQSNTSTEKESVGFLGSLFGKKKSQEDPHHRQEYSSAMYSQAGHITAGSLLDMRNKGGHGGGQYYRYPIHVERAVYRLSHIKLANPRRPLYEQVLISNLMFWYLSIINRSQQQQQHQQHQQQQQLQQHQQQSQQSQSQQPQTQTPQQQHNEQSQQNEQQSQHASTLQLQQQSQTQASQQSNHQNQDQMQQQQSQMDKMTAVAMSAQEVGAQTHQQQSHQQGGVAAAIRSNSAPPLQDSHTQQQTKQAVFSSHASEESHKSRDFEFGAMREEPESTCNVNGVQDMNNDGNHASMYSSSNKQPLPSKAKRGGLVKPNRAPPGSRSAETAIPAAGYGAQHRQINSEMAHTVGGVTPTGTAGNTSNNYYLNAGGQAGSNRSNSKYSMNQDGSYYSTSMGKAGKAGNSSAGSDEYSWLGASRDRRSPNGDERRSDPLSEGSTSAYLSDVPLLSQVPIGASPHGPRQPYQRSNEVIMGIADENHGSNRGNKNNTMHLRRGSGDSNSIGAYTSSPSSHSFTSNNSNTTDINSSFGKQSEYNHNDKLTSLMDINGNHMIPSESAHVLLDAARSSQSRRR